MKFLAETALLTHGLASLTNEEIRQEWMEAFGGTPRGEEFRVRHDGREPHVVWLENGQIKTGGIDEYLRIRSDIKSDNLKNVLRVDARTLDEAVFQGKTAALTASATMEICRRKNIEAAVTAGMGGIGDIKGEELCPDLPGILNSGVILISTGPKDMLDRAATMEWLTSRGAQVVSAASEDCTGYVFIDEPLSLPSLSKLKKTAAPLLIINEIPESKRIIDKNILAEAISAGKQAEQRGEFYHPAVNSEIDRLTDGYSSKIQLRSFIENIKLAQEL